MDFHDTYKHWSGEFIYRRMSKFYDADKSVGSHSLFWRTQGPMAGTGKPHGHWITNKFGDDNPYHKDEFYWYGEEVSEGNWHLRNK
jgi:hypothetical protein